MYNYEISFAIREFFVSCPFRESRSGPNPQKKALMHRLSPELLASTTSVQLNWQEDRKRNFSDQVIHTFFPLKVERVSRS